MQATQEIALSSDSNQELHGAAWGEGQSTIVHMQASQEVALSSDSNQELHGAA